jgi:hypothetical protein
VRSAHADRNVNFYVHNDADRDSNRDTHNDSDLYAHNDADFHSNRSSWLSTDGEQPWRIGHILSIGPLKLATVSGWIAIETLSSQT